MIFTAKHRGRKTFISRCTVVLVVWGAALHVCAQSPSPGSEPPQALRVRMNGAQQMAALEVPVVHYTPPSGASGCATVDFIGAVHIAEESFYNEVNKRFTQYDAVLFELVADAKRLSDVRSRGKTVGPQSELAGLTGIQKGLARILGLQFQLDKIDYSASNLVHADLSPEQLEKAMEMRGESVVAVLLKLLLSAKSPKMEQASAEFEKLAKTLEGIDPIRLVLVGPTPDESLRLKRVLSYAFTFVDDLLRIVAGDQGSAIIHDRNEAVVKVLERECAQGRNRRIGIFYGTAHLPDLHERLKARSFSIAQTEWLTAWKLTE